MTDTAGQADGHVVSFPCIYIHVPFCRGACDYCAFYSVPDADDSLMDAYVERVCTALIGHRPRSVGAATIFLGGGTPPALGGERLAQLLACLRRCACPAADAEVTVEMNPGDLRPDVLDVLAAGGVNRLSVGVQSFSPVHRATLGRFPDGADLKTGFAAAAAVGIHRWNVDLIFGIPGQSVAHWTDDLNRALDLGIEHLSTYALTVEEGTALAQQAVAAPVGDPFVACWDAADTCAAAHGLRRYEVSNFARPGAECRHNLGIWLGGRYLGLGPAAASFDGVDRWSQAADLGRWLAGAAPEADRLTSGARAREIVAFGLRTVNGWAWPHLVEAIGPTRLDALRPALTTLAADGLLALDDEGVRPTRRGLLFADTVVESLL